MITRQTLWNGARRFHADDELRRRRETSGASTKSTALTAGAIMDSPAVVKPNELRRAVGLAIALWVCIGQRSERFLKLLKLLRCRLRKVNENCLHAPDFTPIGLLIVQPFGADSKAHGFCLACPPAQSLDDILLRWLGLCV